MTTEEAPSLSDEQNDVVSLVASGRNVVAIAKPGTGKTTVALAAARRLLLEGEEQGRTLILTYNRKLKEECRQRVDRMGCGAGAVEVHSYHAAASRFFAVDESGGADDALIHEALAAPPKEEVSFSFRLVVVDEAQDLTPLFFSFLRRLLSLLPFPPVLLVVGDPFQRIFGYIGARVEYMDDPSSHFGDLLSSPLFEERHLSLCWRITPEMAEWVNANLDPRSLVHSVAPEWWHAHGAKLARWWGDGVRSGKASAPGSVVHVSNERTAVFEAMQSALAAHEPEQCALLCLSVRRNPLVASILDAFSSTQWAVAATPSAWEPPDDAAKRKAAVSTIHRFKGLERDFVAVVGLDAARENGSDDPLDLHALFFVAATRARKRLLVISGPVPYATLRRRRIAAEQPRRASLDVASLLAHAPFDAALSVPHGKAGAPTSQGGVVSAELLPAVAAEGVCLTALEAARLAPGRESGTAEDLSCFLGCATAGMVAARRDGPSFYAFVDKLRAGPKVQPDVRAWLDDEARRWERADDALLLAVARSCVSSRYGHVWRQARPGKELSSALERCAQAAERMLYLLEREELGGERLVRMQAQHAVLLDWPLDWYADKFEATLSLREERPDFVTRSGSAAVWIVVSPSVSHYTVLNAAAAAALLALRDGRQTTAYVLSANDGAAFRIKLHGVTNFHLLHRITARRAGEENAGARLLAEDLRVWEGRSFF